MAAALQKQSQRATASCRSTSLVRTPVVSSRALRYRVFQEAAPLPTSRAALLAPKAVATQGTVAAPESTEAAAPVLPKGYHLYETMLILRPTFSDEERDRELAKFEAFLNKEECMEIRSLVRGRCRMAYPIKNNWEGIYVIYYYVAKRSTAKAVQMLLSTPESGSEGNVLRHITLCRA